MLLHQILQFNPKTLPKRFRYFRPSFCLFPFKIADNGLNDYFGIRLFNCPIHILHIIPCFFMLRLVQIKANVDVLNHDAFPLTCVRFKVCSASASYPFAVAQISLMITTLSISYSAKFLIRQPPPPITYSFIKSE